jgi:DNA-binding NarL/FixJ family response regulator
MPDAPALPLPELTSRERDVLECVTAGFDRGETARRLGVSVHTVRTHLQSIYAKLDVHSSIEAVSVAMRAGLVSAGA